MALRALCLTAWLAATCAVELETESFAALAKEASSSLAAYQAEITALAKEVKDLKAQSAGTLGLSVPARL